VLSPATSFKAYHQKIYVKRIVTKLIMIAMLVMIGLPEPVGSSEIETVRGYRKND
jgi:hypothetical protein